MLNIPKEYLDLNNDFGFTAVDEDEVTDPIITSVVSTTEQQLKARIAEIQAEHQKQLLGVEKIIMPLLVNLLKDADTKEYIKWPNRKVPIETAIEKILDITRNQ
jgi:hypothetical protein